MKVTPKDIMTLASACRPSVWSSDYRPTAFGLLIQADLLHLSCDTESTQWWKSLIPVHTIVIPYSSHASITDSSAFDPPGCTTHLVPTAAA